MMKTVGTVALLCAALAGCSGDVESQQGQGGAGGQGNGGQGGAGGQGDGGQGGTGGQGNGGDDGSCTVSSPCKEGTCLFPEGSCDPVTKGVCQNGFTCDGPPSGPACGCDGNVVEGEYAECTFWGDGKPYSGPELCAKGTFSCGGLMCKRHVEVCIVTLPGVPGDPSYECRAVAESKGYCAHGIADCSCLDLQALGCADESCCSADADHQETITIALP